MNKIVLKSLLFSLLFVAMALLVEMVQFLYYGWGVLPEYFLFNFGIILMFAFLIFAITHEPTRITVMSIIFGIQVLLAYGNMCVYKNLGTVFSFDMIYLVNETTEVAETGVFVYWPIPIFLMIIASFIFSVILISKIKVGVRERKKFSNTIFFAIVFVGILSSFGVSSISRSSIVNSTSDSELFTDSFLYSSFYSANQAFKKFGSYGFYTESLFRMLLGIKADFYTADEAVLYMNSREYNPQDLDLWAVCQENDRIDDVIVIMAESFEWYAINPELTPVLYALANGYDFSSLNVKEGEWFYNYEYKEKDDGTYNTIRNSSVQYNELLEKTFGLTMVNFYSKAKTDYSEASVVLGSYPFGESFTERNHFTSTGIYDELNYSFSLPSKLKESGYSTKYFHTWKKSFYGRTTLLPMFGFEKTLFLENMRPLDDYRGTLLRQGALDNAFMQIYLDDFIKTGSNENYFSFFTTVSTHGSYYDRKAIFQDIYPIVEESNWLKSEDEELNQSVLTYLAGAVDLEYAVSYMVYNLIMQDKLDNTMIVFYSDHNCYYDNNDLYYKNLFYSDYYNEYMGKNYHWAELSGDLGISYTEKSTARYNVPAFIYSTRITDDIVGEEGHYITKTTQAFDIMPTILTLLGIEYNPSLYLGYPVVCNVEDTNGNITDLGNNILISAIDGVLNKYFYSEDGVEIVYSRPDSTEADEKEFTQSASKLMEKWLKISALYKYDLFGSTSKAFTIISQAP